MTSAGLRSTADLLRVDGVLARCTMRHGGVSEGPYASLNVALHVHDDPSRVLENRERAAAALGVPLDSFVFAQQTHGAHVEIVTAADRGRGVRDYESGYGATDALITRETGTVLAITVADCVPVLLFDPVTPAAGIAHAGWRGTVAQVARRTVEAMQSAFGTRPEDVIAAIGPSIGPDSFEVGRDVAAAFPDARPKGAGTFTLDLWTANANDLVAAGVPASQIEVAGIDTFTDERFFSHRRDGHPHTGRFLAVAVLTD
jgi:YfiH family protein